MSRRVFHQKRQFPFIFLRNKSIFTHTKYNKHLTRHHRSLIERMSEIIEKQPHLGNENLGIPEFIISMPKLARICACLLCSSCRVEWRMEDQLFSSQNSDLNNEQLNKIEQKARAKNTKKATNWGVKKFEKLCDKKKIQWISKE